MPRHLIRTIILGLALSAVGNIAFSQGAEETVTASAEPVCMFDGKAFSDGAEICMRQNRQATCRDGSWSSMSDDSCEGTRLP